MGGGKRKNKFDLMYIGDFICGAQYFVEYIT